MAGRALTHALLDELCLAARQAPRRRVHHCLHAHDAACVHRLFVAMQPDSYVAPHRHLDANKGETLLVLRGQLAYLEFDDQGALLAHHRLAADHGALAVDIPPGVWHTVLALSEDCVFFETKAGPYTPLQPEERAAWAPAEGDPQAPVMLQTLRRLAER